jgi:hypothetical protein
MTDKLTELEFAKNRVYKYNLVRKNSKHDTYDPSCVLKQISEIIDNYPIFEQWYSNYKKINQNNHYVKIINPKHSKTFFFSIEENIPDQFFGSTH